MRMQLQLLVVAGLLFLSPLSVSAADEDAKAAVAVQIALLKLKQEQETPSASQPSPYNYRTKLPKQAEGYAGAYYTQYIDQNATADNRGRLLTGFIPRILPFVIFKHDDKRWHQPGGLEKARRDSWRSDKFRSLPPGETVQAWVGLTPVKNSYGHYQSERALHRRYPDGTRFDEVLVNTETDEVFEHRIREKHDGKWLSDIIYRNPKARPEGYEPVSLMQCAGCHSEAGTGKYADGLVPGGDGVLSDPLPWHLIGIDPETEVRKQHEPEPKRRSQTKQAPPSSTKTACECQGRGNCVCREDQCSCHNCGKGPNRAVNGKAEKVSPQPPLPSTPPAAQQQMYYQTQPQYFFPRQRQNCPT